MFEFKNFNSKQMCSNATSSPIAYLLSSKNLDKDTCKLYSLPDLVRTLRKLESHL